MVSILLATSVFGGPYKALYVKHVVSKTFIVSITTFAILSFIVCVQAAIIAENI